MTTTPAPRSVSLALVLLATGCLVQHDAYEARRAQLIDHDGDGLTEVDGDCDDADPESYPGAPERCDAADNDCDGDVDEDATDATTWYRDADGDGYGSAEETVLACGEPAGHVGVAGDCDDGDGGVNPGAGEIWYDGVDQDCVEDSDYDADGDGADSEDYGGDDCADDDATRHPEAEEGWQDLGVDNDCDGQITDQAVQILADVEHQRSSDEASAALGTQVLAVRMPEADSDTLLVASAPMSGSESEGTLFVWHATDFVGSDATEDESAVLFGSESGALLGFGLSQHSSATGTLLGVAEIGQRDGRGAYLLFNPEELVAGSDSPIAEITGEQDDAYLGTVVLSDHDQDGDGVNDLVVASLVDDTVANNAGRTFLFWDVTSLEGEISAEDADVIVTSDLASGSMSVTSPGDYDGDGRQDLGCWRKNSAPYAGAGLIITELPSTGVVDAQDSADLWIWGVPTAIMDTDEDGLGELYAHIGEAHRYDLPLSSSNVTGEEHGTAKAGYRDGESYVTTILPEPVVYGDMERVVVSSEGYEVGQEWGLISFMPATWVGTQNLDDANLLIRGSNPGDRAGASMTLVDDLDGDNRPEVWVGAPGSDALAGNGGSVYLVASPR